MKKRIIVGIALLSVLSVFGCGKSEKNVSYKDGEYQGRSSIDDWGGFVTVDISVKDGKITTVNMMNYEAEGKEKGETYGMKDGQVQNEGLYKIAQNAVLYSKEYPGKLLEKQDVEEIDVIAGATVTHKSFKEAVNAALKDAKE